MADETGYILLSRRVFPGYVLELAMHAQEVVQYPWDSVYILYSPPSTHFLERWNVLAARRRHCGWDSVYMRAPLLGQLWVTALLSEGDQQPTTTTEEMKLLIVVTTIALYYSNVVRLLTNKWLNNSGLWGCWKIMSKAAYCSFLFHILNCPIRRYVLILIMFSNFENFSLVPSLLSLWARRWLNLKLKRPPLQRLTLMLKLILTFSTMVMILLLMNTWQNEQHWRDNHW